MEAAANNTQTLQERICEIQSEGRKRLLDRMQQTQELAGLLANCEEWSMRHLASRGGREVWAWAKAASELESYLNAHTRN